MYIYSELSKYLELKENHQFGLKLAQPLRTTRIKSLEIMLLPDIIPQGGRAPERLLSQSDDWSAAWEISDVIISKQVKSQ